MVSAASLLVVALAFPTMTLSQGFKAPLLDDIQGHQAPLRDEESRRLIGGWGDGTTCLFGTTCASCINEATWWYTKTFSACGQEPKLADGTKCWPGFSCRACENESTWWAEKNSAACGKQPTPNPTPSPTPAPTTSPTPAPSTSPTAAPTRSPSASPTAAPTRSPSASPTPAPTRSPSASPTSTPTRSPTYNLPLNSQCYGTGSSKEARDAACAGDLVCARAGYDGRHFGGCHTYGDEIREGAGLFGILHHCCSKVPDDTFKADGEKCLGGTTALSTCFKCKNQATFWYSKMSQACGEEPKWNDGTICLKGTSCSRCKNTAKWIWSKFSFVCGGKSSSGSGRRLSGGR